METHVALEELMRDYRADRITRREVMRRAVSLGLTVPVVSAVLLAERGASAAPAGRASDPASPRREAPKTGGTLREGYDLDFSRMDPVSTNWYDPGFYALYEHVITLDPDGNYVPQLAETWGTSEDGLKVTFTIRPNLTFHSGAPLDANAIKAVYDAIKDPANASPLAVLFTPVASIDAPDATTVVLNLSNPYWDIYNVVSTGYWAIVNTIKRAELGAEYGKQEIDGSGPFTFTEWVPGSHVSVARWENYPGSNVPYFQNKGKAYLDGIRWSAILEASQRATLIENNEIDSVHAPAFQDIARLESNPDLNTVRLKEWSGYFFGINHERTDLDFHQVTMRQAISAAVNRQAISDALLFGEGEPLFGPITTADRYYTKDVERFNQFNLDQAKASVAALGWAPNGDGVLEKSGVPLEMNLVIQAESFNQQLGQVIQDQLRQLGVQVNVQAFDRGTYFGELGKKPDAHLFYYAWPVPIDVVILFVGSATIPGPNWSQASVPEVDAAIAAWQSAGTEEELAAAGMQFQLAIAEHLPIIPLINRNSIWVNRKTVHGYLPHQWNLYPYYNDVWLG